MNLSKQTTQTRPTTLEEVKEWLKRIGKDKTIIISPLTESISEFGKVGVYICNLEVSAEFEFITLSDGTVNNLVDYLYIFLGVVKDWVEIYTKPQTLNDIRSWLIRSEKGWIFDISDETMYGLTPGVYISVDDEKAEEYGLCIRGTHFLPILDEKEKEFDHIIGFLASFGVDLDWDMENEEEMGDMEEIEGIEDSGSFRDILNKPASLDEVENWIRRVDSKKYSIIKMMDLPKGSMVSTCIFAFVPMSMSFTLAETIDHASDNYDAVIDYISLNLEIEPDWETEEEVEWQ